MPGDVLLPSHNIVARTEHRVQRTLPVRTVFFGDIIVCWTQWGVPPPPLFTVDRMPVSRYTLAKYPALQAPFIGE